MQWDVFRRCLSLIVYLQQGPQTREDIFVKIYSNLETQNADKCFEEDRRRIRQHLGVDLGYDYARKTYVLYDMGKLALIGLPQSALDALIFLETTFQPRAPQYHNIQSLVGALVPLLPKEQQQQLSRVASLGIDLRPKDQDSIPEYVWDKLEKAYLERRVVEFQYYSPQQADGSPRTHVVEVRKLYFDAARRHYYLYGFCQYSDGPKGKYHIQNYMRYRIGRIVPDTLQVTSQRFPLVAQRPRTYEIEYWLAPSVARQGVSQHFENTEVILQEDGSAIVQGVTDDLFHATRTLLYYGPNCKVLGGQAVLKEVRKVVKGLVALYEDEDQN